MISDTASEMSNGSRIEQACQVRRVLIDAPHAFLLGPQLKRCGVRLHHQRPRQRSTMHTCAAGMADFASTLLEGETFAVLMLAKINC